MENTKDFNADSARQLVGNIQSDELHNLLADIKLKATAGKNELHINNSLRTETKAELIKRGFEIYNHSSIAIQKEGLYYTIKW